MTRSQLEHRAAEIEDAINALYARCRALVRAGRDAELHDVFAKIGRACRELETVQEQIWALGPPPPDPTVHFDQSGDNTITVELIARACVDYAMTHYPPSGGLCIDPACGKDGLFYWLLPEPREWCEIQYGRDFRHYRLPHGIERAHTVITNPPWGLMFTPVLRKSMSVADNIWFIVMPGAAFEKGRLRLAHEMDFGIRTMIHLPAYGTERKRSSGGLPHILFHWQRGWHGTTTMINWVVDPPRSLDTSEPALDCAAERNPTAPLLIRQ